MDERKTCTWIQKTKIENRISNSFADEQYLFRKTMMMTDEYNLDCDKIPYKRFEFPFWSGKTGLHRVMLCY